MQKFYEADERVQQGCEFDVLEKFKIFIGAFLSSMSCIKFKTDSQDKKFNGNTLAFRSKGIARIEEYIKSSARF